MFMFKNYLAAVIFGLISCSVAAQVTVSRLVPAGIAPDRLVVSLDSLFAGAAYQAVDTLTLQLMNFYPLDKDRYWVTVGCMNGAVISKIFSFVARDENGRYSLATPLAWLTRDWTIKTIGRITYHYRSSLNIARARAFDRKNDIIAKKLGLTPENLHFYLTDNYQQIQTLLGQDYDAESAGDVRDGYWKGDSIFATMHNEDYSHDLVHNYTLKIRTNSRNSAAEEGLAYYWGNAYYTDANGQMIDYPEMVSALGIYLQAHPDSTLSSLFRHNAKVFPGLAPEVSARSVISALLFEHIEKTKGVDGVKALINCGKGDDNYFNTLNGLTGINRENFDEKVRGLLAGR
jgi:hypothetical protein